MKLLKRYLKKRKAIVELNKLTDRQLEDIGIIRADIIKKVIIDE